MHAQSNKYTIFERRPDLSVKERFLIAYMVSYQKYRGQVTRLARKYKVSRPFIYKTVKIFSAHLEDCFGQTKPSYHDTQSSLKSIVSFRMEGKCNIQPISTLLQRFGFEHTSVGFISQVLTQVGKVLGNKLDFDDADCFTFVVCTDEIFSKGCPILITVDPKSLLILNIELVERRDAATWISHFQDIKNQKITIIKLIKDGGVGMRAAQQIAMPDAGVQSDTYHAVAHRLGLYVNQYLSKAYHLIGEEYECERLLVNAKTEKVRLKRKEEYVLAQSNAQVAIDTYEDFKFLYHCLLECFQLFDKEGNLKDLNKVIANFDTALELMKSLNINEVNSEMKSIENCKSELFTFFQSAKEIYAKLLQSIDIEILSPLCLAWQSRKNWIKAKDRNRHKWFKNKELHLLNHVKERCGNNYQTVKTTVYEHLDNIIQSSAAVECINSILRPYLNSMKNNVTQEFLNLFMFYHNHRRFKGGLRKGKTPFEIATGCQNQEDWLELVVQKVGLN